MFFEKSINALTKIDNENKNFIIRQYRRMPDYYCLGVDLVSLLCNLFNIPIGRVSLLNKLVSSLMIVKKYEQLDND